MKLQLLAGLLAFHTAAFAQDGFTPLFNGRDLTGWTHVNVPASTFTAKDGMIVSTGKPTGLLRTDKQYENFELELEYRHLHAGGNAGLFVWSYPFTAPGTPFSRSIEVQVLDGHETANYTSHGDIFSIHGAKFTPDRPHPNGWERCLPSEKRAKPAGQWNHYRVVCNNGDIKLAVNGKVVSGGSNSWPRKGFIMLESEGSECHFRNLKIKELPSTGAKPEESAPAPETGFQLLYNGLDLSGWKTTEQARPHWKSQDWILHYDGKAPEPEPHLWTERSFKDFVLICDWRWVDRPKKNALPIVQPDGSYATNPDGSQKTAELPDAGDSGIYLRGNDKSQVNIWCWPVGSGEVYGYRTDPKMSAEVRAGVTPKKVADRRIGEWNRFVITMKGDRLTVVLNDEEVISNAQLPGVPAEGPIALQHHGAAIEFSNIFIKELP